MCHEIFPAACTKLCKNKFQVSFFPFQKETGRKNFYFFVNTMMVKKYSYLALGDSYTIGEQAPPPANFPNQAVALLKKNGFDFDAPRIIAATGWTTDELQAGIVDAGKEEAFAPAYDLVTLLIGVNNQYRGRSADEYAKEFEQLVKQAIEFAGDSGKAVVLSIPDWGVTPFAEGRDRQQIATEIDAYNAINKKIAEGYGLSYIDITPFTREAATDLSLLTTDGLHPSGKEYTRWALKVAGVFNNTIS